MNVNLWIRATIFLPIGIVLSACAALPEPTSGGVTYRGVVSSGCAPHDAVSTVIELEAGATGERASFNLWPPDRLSFPSTIEFDATHPVGQGVFCPAGRECQTADWGRITLRSAAGSAAIEGEWALGLPDGRVAQGHLIADWLTIQALCG